MIGSRAEHRGGFVLVAVVLALALVATAAYLMNREGALGTQLVAAAAAAEKARYVAEAGLQHAIWQAQASGCADYPELSETPFGPHTYAAKVTPDFGSPVGVQATGRLDDGTVRTLSLDGVEVMDFGSVQSIPVVPAAGKDAYVNAQRKFNNYGASAQIGVDSGGAHDWYALLEFDLPPLSPEMEVVSAGLALYLESFGSTNTQARFTLYRMKEPWTEGTGDGTSPDDGVTYDTSDGTTGWSWPGNYDSANPIAVTPVDPSFSGWHLWDITSLASGWYAGSFPNYGMLIVGNNQVRDAFFASSDGADVSRRPALTVSYACRCDAAPSAAILAATSDTYLRDGTWSDTNFGTDPRVEISNMASFKSRALFQFDLSSIPAAAKIVSAELVLNLEGIASGGTASVDVHAVTQAWLEFQATWNRYAVGGSWASPGGDYEPQVVASADIDATLPGPTRWDVTDLVAAWFDDPSVNLGLMLRASAGVDRAGFTSEDGVDPATRPKLIVAYSCPCGAGCGAAGSVYRDEFSSRSCDVAVDYTGSDGTRDWSGETWVESDAVPNSCSGNVQIWDDGGDRVLHLVGAATEVERRVDLGGFASAALRFDYRRGGPFDADHYLVVWASDDAGGSWTELGRLAGPGNDAVYRSAVFDLSPYASADTMIRFSAFDLSATREIHIDNVQVDDTAVPTSIPLVAVADSYLDENKPSQQFGGDAELSIQSTTNKQTRPVLRFDTSGIPPGATVDSATLRLFVETNAVTSDALLQVFAVTEAWDEPDADWNDRTAAEPWATAGGSTATPAVAAGMIPKDFVIDWFEVDIAPLVQEWVDAVTNNDGVLLTNDQSKLITFTAREGADASRHPELVVTLGP